MLLDHSGQLVLIQCFPDSFPSYSGESVDVLILRRKYPLLVPFTNLRTVTLHRLSPHALYAVRIMQSIESALAYMI